MIFVKRKFLIMKMAHEINDDGNYENGDTDPSLINYDVLSSRHTATCSIINGVVYILPSFVIIAYVKLNKST